MNLDPTTLTFPRISYRALTKFLKSILSQDRQLGASTVSDWWLSKFSNTFSQLLLSFPAVIRAHDECLIKKGPRGPNWKTYQVYKDITKARKAMVKELEKFHADPGWFQTFFLSSGVRWLGKNLSN